MKASIYCRVSTDKQELDNQILQLREYCAKMEYDVVEVFSDVISGKEQSRPGFNKLFLEAHKKKFDILVFWDLSRFSRSGINYTLQKLKELDNLGISWHSYQEPYVNTSNEMVKHIVLAVLSSMAKAEREKISERTKAGLERVKKEGRKLGRPKGRKDTKKRYRRFRNKP